MAKTPTPVQIQRGRFGSNFQLVRAMLSAASASLNRDTKAALRYIDDAIVELTLLRRDITGGTSA